MTQNVYKNFKFAKIDGIWISKRLDSLQLLLFETRDGKQEYLSWAQPPWGPTEQSEDR